MKKGKRLLWVILLFIFGILFYGIVEKYGKYRKLVSRLPVLPAYLAKGKFERTFSEKVWAHKANTVSLAHAFAKDYKGLEMDIVFDAVHQSFDVRHPPDSSTGTSLDKMFSSIQDIAGHYFWLDFKNLDDKNARQAFVTLKGLADKYNILENIIVESMNPETLSIFTKNGFYTSYYIPVFDLASASENELKRYYAEVKEHLSKSNVCALSARSESFPFIEDYFPGMDMLLWHLDESHNLSYYATVSFLRMKSKIKVVLVNPQKK